MFYNPLDGKPERMQIGARVLDLAQWIEVDADSAADLAEKRRLLREAPTQVLACLPQGLAGSREVLALLESHLPRYFPALTPSVESADETLHPLAQAALKVQEDLCVMSLEQGEWVLTAAAVCFPNRWDLTAKIGRSLMGIHQPVPHYAEKIGAATDSLFHKLSVERPLWRLNWSIVDTPALHQPVPVPVPDALRLVDEHLADKLWFRRERQTLRKLPQSGDILFTIRTYVHSLAETLRRVPDFRAQLAASMTGLDAAMVDYKGWAGIREALARWAGGASVAPSAAGR